MVNAYQRPLEGERKTKIYFRHIRWEKFIPYILSSIGVQDNDGDGGEDESIGTNLSVYAVYE